jgi:ABC-type antimicrobial peptide transport system permease subunit
VVTLRVTLPGAKYRTAATQSALLERLLHPTDPLTFSIVSLMLAIVGLLACFFPARHATKIDPTVALRRE